MDSRFATPSTKVWSHSFRKTVHKVLLDQSFTAQRWCLYRKQTFTIITVGQASGAANQFFGSMGGLAWHAHAWSVHALKMGCLLSLVMAEPGYTETHRKLLVIRAFACWYCSLKLTLASRALQRCWDFADALTWPFSPGTAVSTACHSFWQASWGCDTWDGKTPCTYSRTWKPRLSRFSTWWKRSQQSRWLFHSLHLDIIILCHVFLRCVCSHGKSGPEIPTPRPVGSRTMVCSWQTAFSYSSPLLDNRKLLLWFHSPAFWSR